MFKNGSNSWLFWGFELSLTHFPSFSKRTPVRFDGGKGQLDIVELATCFLELGDEAALGTLPSSTCHPLSTHEQKSVSLGSPFFLVD